MARWLDRRRPLRSAAMSPSRFACVSLLVLLVSCGGTPDAGDASTDAPIDASGCHTNADCDDGTFCNGMESCEAGRCVAGPRVVCDDAVACTIDSCNEDRARCVFTVPDADGDGHGVASCVDAMGRPLGDDCADDDADRFPGNRERCDAAMHDEDCDPTTHGGVDADGDGFEDARCCNGTSCGDDCDDAHPSAHPGSTEVCNLVDDDCDMLVDEGVSVSGFVDADHDGFGDGTMPRSACGSAAGFSADGTDCDDTQPSRNPGQLEICDGLDNDCDTRVDEAMTTVAWYRDVDGDGFGSAASGTVQSCTPPAGYSLRGTDCNDAFAAISPASAEICNAIDDDCNGVADFVIAPGDLEDDDRDGIADLQCGPPLGLDCDDRDASSGPGSAESCDGRDNDCDGRIDEGATEVAFYRDADGDGFGESGDVRVACTAPSGYVRRGGDCDDTSAVREPGAMESCNALDDDCDGAVDEGDASASCGIVAGSIQACVRGACTPVGCATGYADCSSTAPGCETSYLTDPAHCGSCTHSCGTLHTCTAGQCGPTTSLVAVDHGAGNVRAERVLAIPGSTDVVVLGAFDGTLVAGTTTLTSLGGTDGFAMRLRADTTVVWAFRWGGSGNDAIHAAAMLPDGSAFVVGGEQCGGNICGGAVTCEGFWQRFPSVAAGGCDYAEGVTASVARIYALAMERIGTTNYVYAAGIWQGTANHGIGAATGVSNDGFVLRAREVPGNQPVFEWVRPFTGIYDEVPLDIAIDPTTNALAVVGYTSSSADFGAGPTGHAGYDDPFVVTLDRTSGALTGGGQFGLNTGYDGVERVTYLPNGTMIIAGYHAPGSYFPGAVGTGARNAFVQARQSGSLGILWAQTWSSDNTDIDGLAVSGSRLFVSGEYSGSLVVGSTSFANPILTPMLFELDATTGTVGSLLLPTPVAAAQSGGVAALSDGRAYWDIDHSGAIDVEGAMVGAGSGYDMARVLVTP